MELKVLDKYGDNEWIRMNICKGEWNVAYHGVAYNKTSDQVKKITGLIYTSSFKTGPRQQNRDYNDKNHKGKKVGIGVYYTPLIEEAESYARVSEINGNNYKIVLMVRVKPDSIRYPEGIENYWVVNGTTEEIRPYRILFKKV